LTEGDNSGRAHLDDLFDWCFGSFGYLELFLEGPSTVVFSKEQRENLVHCLHIHQLGWNIGDLLSSRQKMLAFQTEAVKIELYLAMYHGFAVAIVSR
jgi:hypothetical protein